ncbi:MAG: hypothetical protein E7618_00575 [Ruminococcaceae bacterium]|nr:hypothetical protein [Oscillospiraceae bacterium]
MKKLLTLFLALSLLVGMTALFAVSASAEGTDEEVVTADVGVRIYSVANDPYVYLLFDEPMSEPAEEATVIFSLCALGWPTEGDDHPETIRDISRVEYTYQGMVGESGKVMKFANMQNGAPSMDHIPWGLGGLNINAEGPIAVDPHGGYWYYALLGDPLTTANGVQAFEYELAVDDPNGMTTQPGHMIIKTDKDNSTFAVLTVGSVYEFIPDKPDTEPPATVPPATEPPATQQPGTTDAPDTEPAATTNAPTTDPAEKPAADSSLGLIIGIVAAVVVVVVIVVVVVAKKKK